MSTFSNPPIKKLWVLPRGESIATPEINAAIDTFHTTRTPQSKLACLRDLTEVLICLSPQVSPCDTGMGWVQVARAALRYGAWNLLDASMRQLFICARQNPPSSLQGVAAGLATEWALAAGKGNTALVYGRESMACRTEIQRIRGYLALAYALLHDRTAAMLQLACAVGASHRQFNPHYVDFARLHRYRVFRILMEEPDASLQDFHKASPSIRAQFISASLASQQETSPADMRSCVQILFDLGRYRDLILSREWVSKVNPERLAEASEYSEQADQFAQALMPLLSYPLTDKPWLEHLPTRIHHLPAKSIWSCI